MHKQIRFCGLGGQGIVLAGVILGKACMEAGFNAVQTQSYGPEATGGASRSEVVISDSEIDYPSVLAADLLIAMSQPAYDKFAGGVAQDAYVIVDPRYVLHRGEEVFLVEATAIAERVGNRIVSNMIVTGVAAEILGLPHEATRKAMERNVPSSALRINYEALEAGFSEGKRIREAREKGFSHSP